MKLPNIKIVVESATATFKRFPLPILIASVGTAIAMYIVDIADENIDKWMLQILFTCFIGLPCMIGAHLFAERLQRSTKKTLSIGIVFCLVVLYGLFIAPQDPELERNSVILFFVLNVCMHLWVAIAGYLGKKERYGFWHFNDMLFLRVVLSLIFSGVLFGGLSLAIVSLQELFGLNVDEMLYVKLFFFIGGVFNTWFFLSGVPNDFRAVNNEQPFPKGLKIFAQYILIPLAIIYLLILYAYGIKIIVEWSLPRGWVSALIMFYALVGILAVLLVYPLRGKAESTWVKLFSKFFFIALIPLLVLLFVAINVRVSDYGVTEPRYYLMMLGSWLVFVSLYFTFSKEKSIKVIPSTLLVFGLLSLFGPWSAFKVSETSQTKRLTSFFENYKMLSNNKLNKPDKVISKKDQEQMSSIVDYLVRSNRYETLSEIVHVDIYALADSLSIKHDKWKAQREIEQALYGLMFLDTNKKSTAVNRYIDFDKKTFVTKGYSEIYSQASFSFVDMEEVFTRHNGNVLKLVTHEKEPIIYLYQDGKEVSRIIFTDFIKDIQESSDDALSSQSFYVDGVGELKVRMCIESISIDNVYDQLYLLNGVLMIE